MIDIVTLCEEKMIELVKRKINPAKDNLEIPAVILLVPIVGVNHRLPILHLSKIIVHIYTKGKTIHQLAVSYMNNPLLKFNIVFRTQVPQ